MGEAKPTPGPWTIYLNTMDDVVIRKMNAAGYEDCVIARKVSHRDARLIADAGTVFHTTGLTPSQLLEQRDELLAALLTVDLRLRKCFGQCVYADEAYDSFYQDVVRASIDQCGVAKSNTALSKARPNTAEWEVAQQAPAGASKFADVIAVQRGEAEADPSDAYMVGLYNGMSMMDANYRNITDWEPMSTVPKPTPTAQALHPKTADLVQRFSAALAEKLAAAEKKYGYSDGWASPDWMDECRRQLLQHVAKGDPRDVAAYCAFLWHHGARTESAPHPSESACGKQYISDFFQARGYFPSLAQAFEAGRAAPAKEPSP